jgi:hypothetical protein
LKKEKETDRGGGRDQARLDEVRPAQGALAFPLLDDLQEDRLRETAVAGALGAKPGHDPLLEGALLPERPTVPEEQFQGRVEAGLIDEAGAQIRVVAKGAFHLMTPGFIELTGQIGFKVFGVHGVKQVPADHGVCR